MRVFFWQPIPTPEVCEFVIASVTVVVSSAFVVEIGKNLGKTWDGIAENWGNFVSGVQNGLNDLIHVKEWMGVTSNEGKAVMTAMDAYYTSAGGSSSGGKKDDKWYFEASLSHGKIEINPERINEEQAVKEMGRGKNIHDDEQATGSKSCRTL